MKVHYQIESIVAPGYERIAAQQWEIGGLIPFATKLCDYLMLRRAQEDNFTKDETKVTCKRCLNKLNRN